MSDFDVVAIGAHPDDVELTVGGFIAKMTDRGYRVAIVDLTRGESGSNGTPEQRAAEATEAARILGVTERRNLDMGDCKLTDSHENRAKLIAVLRELRPSIVVGNYWEDLHPDHLAAGQMIRNITYPIGFKNYPAPGTPHRPREFMYFMQHYTFDPSFIIDVSDHMQTKLDSVRAYRSQLSPTHNPAPNSTPSDHHPTNIAKPDFIELIEARARHYGSLIHRKYGEPIFVPRDIPMDDPVAHYTPFERT